MSKQDKDAIEDDSADDEQEAVNEPEEPISVRSWWRDSAFWTATGTIVIALFTIVLACVGIDQGISTKAQLHLLGEQINITLLQLQPRLIRTFSAGPFPRNGEIAWGITPSWTNRGSIPAIDIEMAEGIGASKSDVPIEYLPKHHPPLGHGERIEAGETISEPTMYFSNAVVEQAAIGKAIIYVSGIMRYRDPLPNGKIHTEYWCNTIAPIKFKSGFTFSFPTVVGHNCGKEEQHHNR